MRFRFKNQYCERSTVYFYLIHILQSQMTEQLQMLISNKFQPTNQPTYLKDATWQTLLTIKSLKKIIMRLCYSEYEKVFILAGTILPVHRKHKERGRPSKSLWTYLACSYEEAPTVQPDRFAPTSNTITLFGFQNSTPLNPKLSFLMLHINPCITDSYYNPTH